MTIDERQANRHARLLKRQGHEGDDQTDRELAVNLAVAKELERLPKGMTFSSKMLALQAKAMDCYALIDEYLIKLSTFGHVTRYDGRCPFMFC